MRWHPFFLNPDASKEGVNKIEMYNQKFGEQRVKQMIPMMTVGNCISCLYIDVAIVCKFSSIIITLLLLSS